MVSTQDYHVCNSPMHKLSFISLCISISLPGLKHCVVRVCGCMNTWRVSVVWTNLLLIKVSNTVLSNMAIEVHNWIVSVYSGLSQHVLNSHSFSSLSFISPLNGRINMQVSNNGGFSSQPDTSRRLGKHQPLCMPRVLSWIIRGPRPSRSTKNRQLVGLGFWYVTVWKLQRESIRYATTKFPPGVSKLLGWRFSDTGRHCCLCHHLQWTRTEANHQRQAMDETLSSP